MDTVKLAPFVAAAGVVSHLSYFNRGEHHLRPWKFFQLFSLGCIGGTALLSYADNSPIPFAFAHALVLAVSFLAGLYASTLIYRAFFHPLSKFPGPFGARLSSLYFSFQLKDGDAFKKVEKLHQQHGQFVRYGSSDLSITHPKAIPIIYGPGSKCRKAAWYDINVPMVSLQTMRSKADHDK